MLPMYYNVNFTNVQAVMINAKINKLIYARYYYLIEQKRAADAETHVNELKQELLEVKADNTILRQQLHGTNSAKENVQFASQQLHKIVENAKESVK